MAPVTEIAFLPLQAGKYPDDASSPPGQTHKDLLEVVLAQDGAQRAYWAREVENSDMLRWFIDWDSLDDHKKFMASEQYKPFLDRFRSLLGGSPVIYHANFTPHPPTEALSDTSSPVTEVLTIYFPTDVSDSSKSDFEEGLKKFVSVIEQNSKEHRGSSGGWVIEDVDVPGKSGTKAKAYVALLGWTSIEAHMLYRETQAFKDSVHHLLDAKDMMSRGVVHVSCKEVSKGSDAAGGIGDALDGGDVQEEVLNPQGGGKNPPKTASDGSTTKNNPPPGQVSNATKNERQGRA